MKKLINICFMITIVLLCISAILVSIIKIVKYDSHIEIDQYDENIEKVEEISKSNNNEATDTVIERNKSIFDNEEIMEELRKSAYNTKSDELSKRDYFDMYLGAIITTVIMIDRASVLLLGITVVILLFKVKKIDNTEKYRNRILQTIIMLGILLVLAVILMLSRCF